MVWRRLPHTHDRLADLNGEWQLGAGEGLGGVFVSDAGARGGGSQLLGLDGARPGPLHCDVDDPFAVESEHHPALQFGGRVVEVNDRRLGAGQRFVGALDEFGASLGQHLDRDIVGNGSLGDDLPDEVEVGLARRWEAHLDLLESHRYQEFEESPLAGRVHRVDERLVAIPQVHRAPDRGRSDDLIRPGALPEADGLERAIPVEWHRARLLASGRPDAGHGSSFVRWLLQMKKPPDTGGRKRLGECRDVALAYMRSRRMSMECVFTAGSVRRFPGRIKATRPRGMSGEPRSAPSRRWRGSSPDPVP